MKKKLLVFIAVFVMAIALCGCSSPEKKTIATLSQKNGDFQIDINVELYHDGKVVSKQIQKSTLSGKTLKDVEDLFNANVKMDYEALTKDEGFDYSLEKKDQSIIETLSMDFDKLSTETYNQVLGQNYDTSKKVQIDYEKTIQQMKTQGFTITEE